VASGPVGPVPDTTDMNAVHPLRIIHCVRAPIGGIFRHVADLAVAQAEAGHEVGIVCDSTTGGAFEDAHIARIDPLLPLGVDRIPMDRRISRADFQVTRALVRRLRAIDPHVIHGHGAKGGAYARVIGTLLRVLGRETVRIYCPHGGSLHFDPDTREGRTYFRLERMLEAVTDGLVFVSDYERRAYETKVRVPRTLVRRVHNGLKPEEFRPIAPTAGMVDLMYAGMMRDLKGPQVLIEALPILARDHGLKPTVRMMGAGDDRSRYQARVRDLGLSDRVTFSDPLPTRTALSQARILVVPSLAESMPYLVLEAAAARIPMVATNVGGLPEIFGDRSNRLVKAGDPVALAAGIAAVLEHEAGARLDAEDFAEGIAERFSIAAMAADITAFYDEARAVRGAAAPASEAPAPLRMPVPVVLRTGNGRSR
jgi:glycosyltransferase involved in cell wall biosynthesis